METVTAMQRMGAATGAAAVALLLLSGIGALADEQVRAATRQAVAESKGAASPGRGAGTRQPAFAECRPGTARAG